MFFAMTWKKNVLRSRRSASGSTKKHSTSMERKTSSYFTVFHQQETTRIVLASACAKALCKHCGAHAKHEQSCELFTWLILPVVICLSQRLSHASLSISIYTVKLRKAHYISYSLFDGKPTTWITVVILELIHAQKRFRKGPWTY